MVFCVGCAMSGRFTDFAAVETYDSMQYSPDTSVVPA